MERERAVLRVTLSLPKLEEIVSVNHRTMSRVKPPLTKAGRWVHIAARNGASWCALTRDAQS